MMNDTAAARSIDAAPDSSSGPTTLRAPAPEPGSNVLADFNAQLDELDRMRSGRVAMLEARIDEHCRRRAARKANKR